jgi:PhnB protein
MKSRIDAYFSFKDNARQAMEFYQSVFGGKLEMQTYKDYNASQAPSEDNKIMHATLEAENGISFMGADTPMGMEYLSGMNGRVALSGDNEAELKGYFQKLSAGGTVTAPMEKAPWGDHFGMCTDKFGIGWMVNIAGEHD